MKKIEELGNLPPHIQREILEYADYIISKYDIKVKKKVKWSNVSMRGSSKREMASDTVIKMRDEEKW